MLRIAATSRTIRHCCSQQGQQSGSWPGPYSEEEIGDDADEEETFDDWMWRTHEDNCKKYSQICSLLIQRGAATEELLAWLDQFEASQNEDVPLTAEGALDLEEFED